MIRDKEESEYCNCGQDHSKSEHNKEHSQSHHNHIQPAPKSGEAEFDIDFENDDAISVPHY